MRDDVCGIDYEVARKYAFSVLYWATYEDVEDAIQDAFLYILRMGIPSHVKPQSGFARVLKSVYRNRRYRVLNRIEMSELSDVDKEQSEPLNDMLLCESFTEKEEQVLQAIIDYGDQKRAAQALGVSPQAVNQVALRIKHKLFR